MEIKGKVVSVLEPVSGTSAAGKDWKKQTFVILEDKEQYPKNIAIDAFNKDLNVNIGDMVNVFINIESKEHNGRWFTNIGMWKYDIIGASNNHNPNSSGGMGEEIPNNGQRNPPMETDDLPF